MSNTCDGSYVVYGTQNLDSIEGVYDCKELPWIVYTLSYVSTGKQVDQAAYCKKCSLVSLKDWVLESADNPDIAFTIHRYNPSADDM